MSSTKLPVSGSAQREQANGGAQPRQRQSGRELVGRSETGSDRAGRDIDLDAISGIIGGDEPQDDRRAPPRKPADDKTGRGDADQHAPEDGKPRPALEIDDDDDESQEPSKKRKAKKTLAEYAEEMELDAKALYELVIPSADPADEPMTLGELKDKYRDVRDLQRKADDFEDSRQTAMNEIFVARQQIDGLLGRMTSILSPEQFAQTFSEEIAKQNEMRQRAYHQTLEFFPEWRDAQVMQRDRTSLTDHLGTYGFSKVEVDSIGDARLIKYAMDAMRLINRYKRLKENMKVEDRGSVEPPSGRKRVASNATTDAKKLAEQGDIIGGVAKLIG